MGRLAPDVFIVPHSDDEWESNGRRFGGEPPNA